MENVLKYKDFTGNVQFNTEDSVFHGRIEFITDLITFEGTSVRELEDAFKEAVDDYIELCTLTNKDPKRSCSGTFNVPLKPKFSEGVKGKG